MHPSALFFTAIAIASAPAAAQAPAVVEITKFAYAPREITVAPGTTVRWTNHDETPHTVTDKVGELASPGLDTGDLYEHAFANEGDYPYTCAVHPFMTGVVHVRRP
ncbi:plastocyanin [Dokdonella fugitiva]|uniref:Plastocyanin n=1 Tax=Dokdonella fugitiva TaxID=328517 RepID=A0A839F113_9GAMM|nr:cupredoxin family copper-binding protein [Dokdonella fugitiva]MBA8889765.1 plastocyanin [Dokdonella fugitiva]